MQNFNTPINYFWASVEQRVDFLLSCCVWVCGRSRSVEKRKTPAKNVNETPPNLSANQQEITPTLGWRAELGGGNSFLLVYPLIF